MKALLFTVGYDFQELSGTGFDDALTQTIVRLAVVQRRTLFINQANGRRIAFRKPRQSDQTGIIPLNDSQAFGK